MSKDSVVINETLQVCPSAEVVTTPSPTPCKWCRKPFIARGKHHRFCGDLCRQNNHREPRRSARRAWVAERFRAKSLTFDGLFGGPNNDACSGYQKKELAYGGK